MAPISAPEFLAITARSIAGRLPFHAPVNAESPSLLRRLIPSPLSQRSGIVAIPLTYQIPANNPSPGTVVGIVLGVVLGLCFILWIFYVIFNTNNPPALTEVEVVKTRSTRRSRPPPRSVSEGEIIEVSRTRSQPRRTREIIVEEEIRRPPPEEDDVVVVIEEHSPVRRQRRSSGYRNIDPNELGGGRRDRRDVR